VVCFTFAAVPVFHPLCLHLFTVSNEFNFRVNISRRTRPAGHLAHRGKKNITCEILVEKLERRRRYVGRR